MKKIILVMMLAMLMLFTASCAGEEPAKEEPETNDTQVEETPVTEERPDIKDTIIPLLGKTDEAVKTVLGEPSAKGEFSGMTVHNYENLILYYSQDDSSMVLTRIEYTGYDRSYGVKIGSFDDEIIEVLGEPSEESDEKIVYSLDDKYVVFHFTNGRNASFSSVEVYVQSESQAVEATPSEEEPSAEGEDGNRFFGLTVDELKAKLGDPGALYIRNGYLWYKYDDMTFLFKNKEEVPVIVGINQRGADKYMETGVGMTYEELEEIMGQPYVADIDSDGDLYAKYRVDTYTVSYYFNVSEEAKTCYLYAVMDNVLYTTTEEIPDEE